MIHLVYGYDQNVALWVAKRLGITNIGPSTAIGIANGCFIIGGALYNNYHTDNYGRGLFIEMSFATLDKRWASRGRIAALLAYPFFQLRVGRVQLTIAKRDKSTRRFVERLGFKLEGIARKAHHNRTDSAVYSLLQHEWMVSPYGKIYTKRPRGTGPEYHSGGANGQQSGNCALQLRAQQPEYDFPIGESTVLH